MARRKQPDLTEFSMTIDGKECLGSYIVENKVVTVTYGMRRTSTQIGGGTARSVARMLLRELVNAEKTNPQ